MKKKKRATACADSSKMRYCRRRIEDDEDVEEDDDDDDDDDDESSIESDEDNDERPWKKLRLEVIYDLSSNYDEQVERYQKEGSSKNVVEAKASNFLLPSYRKKLRGLYLHYLKWIRHLKSDHIHKEVMATLRRYMDDDDMDFEEAAEAAVNKRKFLLNRVFEPIEVPDESPDEEADDVRRHPLAK
ncbi:hypothetical protein ACROYT_G028366 [Oculina patagonica]